MTPWYSTSSWVCLWTDKTFWNFSRILECGETWIWVETVLLCRFILGTPEGRPCLHLASPFGLMFEDPPCASVSSLQTVSPAFSSSDCVVVCRFFSRCTSGFSEPLLASSHTLLYFTMYSYSRASPPQRHSRLLESRDLNKVSEKKPRSFWYWIHVSVGVRYERQKIYVCVRLGGLLNKTICPTFMLLRLFCLCYLGDAGRPPWGDLLGAMPWRGSGVGTWGPRREEHSR